MQTLTMKIFIYLSVGNWNGNISSGIFTTLMFIPDKKAMKPYESAVLKKP